MPPVAGPQSEGASEQGGFAPPEPFRRMELALFSAILSTLFPLPSVFPLKSVGSLDTLPARQFNLNPASKSQNFTRSIRVRAYVMRPRSEGEDGILSVDPWRVGTS